MKAKQISRILTVAMAGIMAASIVGCSSQEKDTVSSGKKEKESVVKMAVSSEPDNLNPMMSSATDTQAMMMNVYEGLLTFDKDGNFLPGLAESYDIKDDGKTYDFKLKKGIEFHNGHKFDAGDVKYTMYVSIFATVICRVLFSIIFAVWMNLGVIGIAIAMCCDWGIRSILFVKRYKSGKWKRFSVI